MGPWGTRSYLQKMVNQAYLDQEINCYFCSKSNVNFCQKTSHYEEELKNLIPTFCILKTGLLFTF